MKRKDLMMLVVLGVVTAIVAYVVSGVVFKANARTEQIPTVEVINANFPDVRNETDYKVIFNEHALDATLPVQIQGNNNNNLFVGH
jgi:type II secretory pathway pseudopilin PulG